MSHSFSQKLITIINYYRQPGNAETCRIVAEQLCNQISPGPNWTWNYVMCLWREKLQPSKKMSKTVDILYAKIFIETANSDIIFLQVTPSVQQVINLYKQNTEVVLID